MLILILAFIGSFSFAGTHSIPSTTVEPEETGLTPEEANTRSANNTSGKSNFATKYLAEPQTNRLLHHTETLLAKTELPRVEYLANLEIKEMAALLEFINRKTEEHQAKHRKVGLAHSKRLADDFAILREDVERAFYPPILAKLKNQYREDIARVQYPSPANSRTKRPSIDLEDLRWKVKAFDAITVAEIEQLREKQKKSGIPSNDARAKQYIKDHKIEIAEFETMAIRKIPKPLRAEFSKYFEPHVSFDSEGNATFDYIPTEDFQLRQAEQLIAISTGIRGRPTGKEGEFFAAIADENQEFVHRLSNLRLPDDANYAIQFWLGMSRAQLNDTPISKLIDRSQVRGGGIEATHDEFTVAMLAAGTAYRVGKISLEVFKNTVRELTLKKAAQTSVAGGVVGTGLDLTMQAAQNIDSYRKGQGWRGYDPIQTVHSAGMGMLLGPLVHANPVLGKLLAAPAFYDGAVHSANGDTLTAAASVFMGALAFKPAPPTVGDAVLADLHLSVKRNANGEIVIDTTDAAWGYLQTSLSILKSKKLKGKLFLNGDVADAIGLKKIGNLIDPRTKQPISASNNAKLRADLIDFVASHIENETGWMVETGLGNHEAITNPTTGVREGNRVAEALEILHGRRVYNINDTDRATLRLSSKADGKSIYVDGYHNLMNLGENLAKMLPPDTLIRVGNDIYVKQARTKSNGQDYSVERFRFTSDLHVALQVDTVQVGADGTIKGFTLINTGTVNGTRSTPLLVNGVLQPEIGTLAFLYPTKSGGVVPEFWGITPNPKGGYKYEPLDMLSTRSVPNPETGISYPSRIITDANKTLYPKGETPYQKPPQLRYVPTVRDEQD